VTGSAGFGIARVLTGYVQLACDSAIEFLSGQIARIDAGGSLLLNGRNFGVGEGALTFADSRSFTDLREFFFLSDPPRPFQAIKAPLSAKDFLTAKPSNIPPDDE
jgi:hypothetical protein